MRIDKRIVFVDIKVSETSLQLSSDFTNPFETKIQVKSISELEVLELLFANIIEKAKEVVELNESSEDE